MKKYFPFVVVLVLVLVVVGAAQGSSVWAGASSHSVTPVDNASSIVLRDPAEYSAEPSSISITGSGTYNVGGFCKLEIEYKLASGLRDEADVEVNTNYSKEIPFGYEGNLYLPGCHIVHYKDDAIMPEMTSDDGTWRVCFAERPDVQLLVYYYQDEPFTVSPIWIELDTTHENGFACAFAPYTGEYAPGSKTEPQLETTSKTHTIVVGGGHHGTIITPPYAVTITDSADYSVGGICTFTVVYKQPYQSDEIHVAEAFDPNGDQVDDYNLQGFGSFPDPDALLYLPGCHVLHYRAGEITRYEKTSSQGEWEICFAARPDKDMTIYYYLGDEKDQASAWTPLETTTENGIACAPAFFTGVYVPTGK